MEPDAASLSRFLDATPSAATALATLGEPLRFWFRERFGEPTAAQCVVWPALARETDLLLSAPTGSGKTLAAFLPIIDRLLTGAIADGIRCLYVAPLKALVADAGRNLRRCLRELEADLLHVGTRTGDTSARKRREFHRRPPDILLTTPESLAVLLSQARSGEWFRNLRWVIVDEVHAFAGGKRGADLSLSLERLSALTPEPPQRIGLSATCTPLDAAASFLVGAGRPCAVGLVPERTPLDLRVEPLEEMSGRGFVRRLVERLLPELAAQRTTLIFTNTRALAERLGAALRRLPEWTEVVGVHHSSLAIGRRREVERRLKAGELRAVVSSASLELGVDIGSVDAVVLVHPPGGVVRLLQRVGRAGHGPGRPRRGLVLTASASELLEAAVTAAAGQSGQCEAMRIVEQPFDVLCQQLLGMAAQRPWLTDEAFALVRRAWPYRDLAQRDFDDCLDYLTGRRRGGEMWLPSRLRWDGDEFRIADARTARLLRRNVGSIVAEETRPVCLDAATEELDALLRPVGSVDEAFADRLNPGDRFLLDGRCLEFRRIDGRALVVDEVPGYPAPPRWPGSGLPTSPELSRRLYLMRTRVAESLRDGRDALADLFRTDYGLGDAAVAELVDLFERQECVSEIPDAGTCLVEVVHGPNGIDYYVHTPLNRAGNDAVARVAVRRLVRERGRTALSLVADLGFLLAVEGSELKPNELTAVLAAGDFDADLVAATEDSPALRERFRCVALTGLMLLRHPIGRQRRVGGRSWAERQLFDQVRLVDPEFVLLRQARHEMQREVLDAAAAKAFVEELPRMALRWRWLSGPSPLAEGWTQATTGAMETVEGPVGALQRLHAMLTTGAEPS